MDAGTETRACRGCGGVLQKLEPIPGVHLVPPLCPDCGDAAKAEADRAERDAAIPEALRAAGATPRLLRQSLGTHPNRAAAAAAAEWLDLHERGEGRNLWLKGPIGVGKTGIAWGIVRALAEAAVDRYYETAEEDRGLQPRRPVLFLDWATLLDDLRASFDAQRRIERGGDPDEPDPAVLFARACRVSVLALDDLGRERPTPFAVEKLATLVNDRYERELPTVLTSNFGTRDLADRLGASELVAGERIVSRLLEGADLYRFDGESLRRRASRIAA